MDERNIKCGKIIREDGYSDQPYVVKTNDGYWLMTVTVGGEEEGAEGQHVVSLRSGNCGETWEDVVDVSPASLPESSYSVLYKTKYGRVYCFYNFNADNTRGVIGSHPNWGGICKRVDSQGHFVFRYSDDNGKSWSEKWYDIPQREFEVDRLNPYGGKIKFFWNVGKPLELGEKVLVPLYKIREFGITFMEHSEGVLLECANINEERDPEKLLWQTLPDGEIGIRAPKEVSIISEEHSFVRLSDGTVFCVFRTVSGNSYCTYSKDDCHTFSPPVPMTLASGRRVKHPRAANFIWKCENGKYLYWFHNHGGKSYEGRNPVWLCGAWEEKTEDGMRLVFGQPRVILYDETETVRMSYPDLVEDGGEYYLTETQKSVARVHKINKALIESLWQEPREGAHWQECGSTVFTADEDRSFSLRFETGEGAGVLFAADGFRVERAEEGDITVTVMVNGKEQAFLNDDPLLKDGKSHTVTAVFDGGVSAVFFTTDGIICDGGEARQYGYTRFERGAKIAFCAKGAEINRLKALRAARGVHLYD